VRDLYMAYAAQCHKLAEEADNESVRAAWLKLAGSWLELADAAQQRELPRPVDLSADLHPPEFQATDPQIPVQPAS
jgi:hypothetical protein